MKYETRCNQSIAQAPLFRPRPRPLCGADHSRNIEPAFFDGLQNEAGDKFWLVAIAVIGRRSAASRISHPVLAEVCCRDERVDFTHHDAVLFQLSACRQAESKQRAFRSRVHAVLRNSHMNAVPELIFTMLPLPCARISGITA